MGLNETHRSLVGLSALAAFCLPAKASACGLALLLAMDVSLSIDEAEFQLQVQGMATALRQDDVQRVIASVPGGVAMSVLQWSGRDEQAVVLPWTMISAPDEITDFGNQVSAMPRVFVGDTAPGSAIEYGVILHDTNPYVCQRLVIDMSGDGAQNIGRHTGRATELAVNFGITVNGLAIKGSDRGLEAFFLRNIVRGPKSFLESADGFEDFARAFHKKLLREVPIDLAFGADTSVRFE